MNTQASDYLRAQHKSLAARIVELQYALQPDIWSPYGRTGREVSARDNCYHLNYLAEAVQAADPALFIEYLAWVKVLFAGLKFPENALPAMLECTRRALVEMLPQVMQPLVMDIVNPALLSLPQSPSLPPSFLGGNEPIDHLARRYLDSLLSG